jgi:UDP-N-acetylglucosamine:LPS N-acetylglucosamine transferase
MLLRPALEPFDPWFATTNGELAERDAVARMIVLPDSNRHRPLMTLRCITRALRMIRQLRPDLVISTGALPGLVCVVIGRLYGARAIWVDSIANSETSSLSGRLAGTVADLWLTQWQHLAQEGGPEFRGALL